MNWEKIEAYINSINISQASYINLENIKDNCEAKAIESEFRKRKEMNLLLEFESSDFDSRLNYNSILNQAKGIVLIAVPYEFSILESVEAGYGSIANFAWEKDYHKLLKNKLEKIAEFIADNKTEDFNYEICVDTSPLIDRYIMYKSGLGVFGKNKMMINKKFGNAFYIGYMLVDFKIEGDKIDVPQKFTWSQYEGCSNCNLCVETCPSRILGEKIVDFTKCISYLSQKKADLNEEEMSLMGNSIYGCEKCQKICPSNGINRKEVGRDEKNPEIAYEYLSKSPNTIDLFEILKMSNKEFLRKYKDTGFSWRGGKIIKRNALIVLGNSRDRRNYEALLEFRDSYIKNNKDSNAYLLKYIQRALALTEQSARDGQLERSREK